MALCRRTAAADPVIRNANRVLREVSALLRSSVDDGDDDIPFQQTIRSPEELRAPDLSRTRRLDREHEEQGLDTHRRVEDVESFGMPVRGTAWSVTTAPRRCSTS